MPKTRKSVVTSGAKSVAVKIKDKIGGRKSFQTIHRMSVEELTKTLEGCKKRDRNKLRRALTERGMVLPS